MPKKTFRSSARPGTAKPQGPRSDPRAARSAPGIPRYLRRKASGPDAASRGGAAMAFPHAPAISAATGMSVKGAAAVHDPSACAEQCAPAFTDGEVTRFASPSPALHVAAHEAAHHLQHAGLTNDAGLGPERHAHEVAGAVASGGSARHLLGPGGAPVAPALRPYTKFTTADQNAAGQWKVGSEAKVGDQGRTVTTEYQHECYADPALITASNSILEAKKSGIRIKPGGAGPSGMAPDGSGIKSTVKVDYNILFDPKNEQFYADCGVSSREVMGPTGTDTPPSGIYTDAAGNRQETARSTNPATFRDEILMKNGLGADPVSARAAYEALTDTEKDEFDKKHGINRYAAPGVGEAFTRRRADYLGGTGFNFHWGGVIMVAGGDRVTFENFTKGKGYWAKDADWYFETYGPPSKPGQTWHELWKGVGGEGKGMTFAAATTPNPLAMSTADLIKRHNSSTEAGEKTVLDAEIRKRWIKVTVFVKKAQEGTDDVYVRAEHKGRVFQSGEISMGDGQKNTFWVSLDKLAPVDGKIMIKVYESDVFADDMISIIGFDDPYSPQSDDRPWDDAEYHTTAELDR